jgi:RHS repeat-associated protein
MSEFTTSDAFANATGARPTDRIEYTVAEHNGTPVLALRADGTLVENHRTFPNGESWQKGLNPNFAQAFTTYDRDADTHLDYAMARHYASTEGRFMTPDPGHVGANIYDPQSFNAYAYAGGDPINNIDPEGLDYFDVKGDRIGPSGNESNYIVTAQAEVDLIKKSGKKVIDLADVSSAILLPNAVVMAAMADAVNRSNSPSGLDKKGGFHEEGGQYGLDGTYGQIAVAAKAGEYSSPLTGGLDIDVREPSNAADKGRLIVVQGAFHVHPKGEVTIPMAGRSIRWNFDQPPSKTDQNNLSKVPNQLRFVLGARTKLAYIYDASGVLTPTGIPLGTFLQIGRPRR